jgi:predicted deacylase
MFEEVADSIWKVTGPIHGPIITILGGVHGNELTGIAVVKKLREQIECGDIKMQGGTLYLALGNLKAIKMHKRGSGIGRDLNRSFPINLLDHDPIPTYEDSRARELAPVFARSDVLIDMHATNKPSEPFVACLDSDQHEQVYRWFPCTKVLTDPRFVLGGRPVTTDEYTEAYGGIGICYETGLAWDTGHIDEVLENILNLLRHKGVIDGKPPESRSCAQSIFEIIEPIILTPAGFRYAPDYGERSWERFTAGTTLGWHGEGVDKPVIASFDGMIVFPKAEEHWNDGNPLGYLAKQVN